MSKRSDARRDSTRVIVAAMQTGHLPWATNTPKGQKLDLLRGYINQLTEQFLEDENNEQQQSSIDGPIATQENQKSTSISEF